MNEDAPKVFISYSHDSPTHKQWVAELAAELRKNRIDAILDQWDLGLGDDITKFMEDGLTESDRVLIICTENYVRKADAGEGGVAYERMIVTAELVRDLGTQKFIPIIKQKSKEPTLPKFLGARLYIGLTTRLSGLEPLLPAYHPAVWSAYLGSVKRRNSIQ
ncbi:MAG: TIR domain-containing protein [Candidatus Aminicenantes bacterium]|nr:TIR domain-containing protein [Candidatus Aminicenantes bacterium]NIM78981.1 TIR domain-containing protein [Candidatus Aminicenantes bacterium]NIN18239.1 TIR domain-containing protein [Candidatus Aminicenantes bacterium]NIN42136.1 TIR domain-containing protein [Candidatus Aminicenantes bacterium]NIN84892.1 TIR domain-containing protein [Candidatus Aminicenantes bacterium]